jgi:hypothetical protein
MARKIKCTSDFIDTIYANSLFLTQKEQRQKHTGANLGVMLSERELSIVGSFTPARTPEGSSFTEYCRDYLAKYFPDRIKLLKDEKGETYYFLIPRKK